MVFMLWLTVRLLTRLLVLPRTDDGTKDLEILVLRHQLRVLRRKSGRPRFTARDRVVLAAASRVLPPGRWASFIVTPQTLLRWHAWNINILAAIPGTSGLQDGKQQPAVQQIALIARCLAEPSSRLALIGRQAQPMADPRPVELVGVAQLGEQELVEMVEHGGLVAVAQPPAGHAAAVAKLLGQVFPGDASVQHVQDAVQDGAVVQALAARVAVAALGSAAAAPAAARVHR